MDFTLTPRGPYSLAEQNRYFGGWAQLAENETPIVMAFPVEGWESSAAVEVAQDPGGQIRGTVHASSQRERAWRQALAVLSLDADGAGYPDVGKRDPVIGRLQRDHAFLRPVLFHSPYEAACSFVIGHRLRMCKDGPSGSGWRRPSATPSTWTASATTRFHARSGLLISRRSRASRWRRFPVSTGSPRPRCRADWTGTRSARFRLRRPMRG